MRRSYKGAANKVQLTKALGGSTEDLTIQTTTMNNWPDGLIGPFFIVIDRDLSSEEKILCATKSGNTLTVYDDGVVNGRGADGTSVTSHASGAFVEHVFTATDADQANLHVNTNPLHVLTITFATRPASPAVGQIIYQTDTAEYFSWDGSAWTVFGGGSATAYSAKGDLVVGTGVDTDAILSVGADNTVLTADSTTTTGTKWAASKISIPATRLDAVVQTLDGSTWSEGMALSVRITVPEDTEGQVGDVVFVAGLHSVSPESGGTVVKANSSDAALRVTQNGTGDVLLLEDSAHPDTTPFVVNSSGSLLIGTNTSSAVYAAGKLQIVGTSNAHGHIARFTADSKAPSFTLGKSRGTSPTDLGIVSSQDEVGRLGFYADDGTQFLPTALIASYIDGTPGLNDMPGRLSFQTGVDGGPGVAERMRINNAGLITGTGTSLGAWTAYTPTLSNWTLGNGTVSGSYCQIGKVVHFRLTMIVGSTTAIGSSPTFTVPVNMTSTSAWNVRGYIRDISLGAAGCYELASRPASTTAIGGFYTGTNGQQLGFNSTTPFTWDSGDGVQLAGTYEAA